MDDDFLGSLRCPADGSSLRRDGEDWLVSEGGRRYPVVQGVPVLLRDDVPDTLWVASASRNAAFAWAQGDRPDPRFIDTLGLSEGERAELHERVSEANDDTTVISFMLRATSGYMYSHLLRKTLSSVPIPAFRLSGTGEALLDVGCNWGRWVVAAQRAGFVPVGLDPSLGGVLAGKRLCETLGIPASFVVGDSRHLPFRSDAFGAVHSYSVLQHLSRADATRSVDEMARVAAPGGTVFVQMANRLGIRCLHHQAKRGFRPARQFEVRYWSVPDLKALGRRIGRTNVEVDGFFGLGVQPSDRPFMGRLGRAVVAASEGLRLVERYLPQVARLADSVYLRSRKAPV